MDNPVIQSKKLINIVLPGTHDTARQEGVTQLSSFFEQLQDGIRYFDLRLKYYDNRKTPQEPDEDTVFEYDPSYPLSSLITEVNNFMNTHDKEVIILCFNQLYKFDKNIIDRFSYRLLNGFSNIGLAMPVSQDPRYYNGWYPNLTLSEQVKQKQRIVIAYYIKKELDQDMLNSPIGKYLCKVASIYHSESDYTKIPTIWTDDLN
jgi:hypothetical protein